MRCETSHFLDRVMSTDVLDCLELRGGDGIDESADEVIKIHQAGTAGKFEYWDSPVAVFQTAPAEFFSPDPLLPRTQRACAERPRFVWQTMSSSDQLSTLQRHLDNGAKSSNQVCCWNRRHWQMASESRRCDARKCSCDTHVCPLNLDQANRIAFSRVCMRGGILNLVCCASPLPAPAAAHAAHRLRRWPVLAARSTPTSRGLRSNTRAPTPTSRSHHASKTWAHCARVWCGDTICASVIGLSLPIFLQ